MCLNVSIKVVEKGTIKKEIILSEEEYRILRDYAVTELEGYNEREDKIVDIIKKKFGIDK